MGDEREDVTFDVARSIAIRVLINFVGKVHQPLNVGTLVSEDFPLSDHNGSKFDIRE
jgi:hypothetical protein